MTEVGIRANPLEADKQLFAPTKYLPAYGMSSGGNDSDWDFVNIISLEMDYFIKIVFQGNKML